jgi:hypothetical protein
MEKGKSYSREELEKKARGMGNIHILEYKEKCVVSRNVEKSKLTNKHLGEPIKIIDMKTESQNVALSEYERMKTTIKLSEDENYYITEISKPNLIIK